MASEIDVLREHYDRYRAVTLEHLQRLSDEQLLWRPRPDAFNCAQHLSICCNRGFLHARAIRAGLEPGAAAPSKAVAEQGRLAGPVRGRAEAHVEGVFDGDAGAVERRCAVWGSR